MKMRRVLTALLALVMVLSAVPFGVMAANGDTTPPTEEGKLFLDKTATLTGDGSYTIKMEAFATGKTTTQTIEKGVPLDIVLVIDQSGSMADKLNENDEQTKQEALQEAARTFVKLVVADGQKNKVTHRIGIAGFASGAVDKSPWTNTGIYDEKGTFVGYGDTATSKPTYEKFNGTMDTNGTYYVKVGTEYFQLTYNKDANEYVPVNSPAIDRTDLYGQVNGKYEKATYGKYTVSEEAKNPTKGDGNTYYDAKGNQLTWVEEKTTKQEYVRAASIQGGKEYWINYDNNPNATAGWHKVTENIVGSWSDDTLKMYLASGNRFEGKNFLGGGNDQFFDAYELKTTETPTGNWFLSADGKTPVTPVYEKTTKTGWNVNGTPVTELYELQKGAGKWQYQNGSKTVDLKPNDQIYVQTTAPVFKTALVPVTNGEQGQGTLRSSITEAINGFKADGATRTSIGIELGNKIFEANPLPEGNPEKRERIMIVFTDGIPGRNADHPEIKKTETALAVNQAYETKHTYQADVYTIGLYSLTGNEGKEQTTFMEHLSSKYPDAKYKFTSIQSLPKKDDGKTYAVKIDNVYYGVLKGDKEWTYYAKNAKGEGKNTSLPKNPDLYRADLTKGTAVTDPKFSYESSNTTELSKIFSTIQSSISGSTTSVKLDKTSILRDIMSQEGFELTPDSVITVNVIPGDATNAADPSEIKWGKPVKVLALNNPTDGAFATGTYPDSTGKDMTIMASTHMKNPEAGKTNLHTVDVTGFDYKDQYIAQAHKGSKLVVEITGVKALHTITTDQNIYTNHEQSGIWAPVSADGGRALKAPFPKRPTTYMPSKSYVVDYAKPLDLAIADFKLTSAQNIDVDGYDPFATPVIAVKHAYGDAKIVGDHLTYTPKTMKWDGADTFYVFGTTNDATVKSASANANGNVWSKVNVIPANNVYYEDTFVTNTSNGTVGIEYTGAWEEIKDTDPGKNPGSETSGDNHGWIPALKDETGDADGSSQHVDVTNGNTATAKFTFTGTGVDVYSRTNGKTGTILATLRRVNTDGSKTDIDAQVIDTLAVSPKNNEATYYQIPTLSFHEGAKLNENGEYVKDKNNKTIIEELPYATYEVEILVTNIAKDRFEYYLDGVRVYNPLNGGHEAYAPDEQNAQFTEIRDLLLDKNSFTVEGSKITDGPVFIDQIKAGQGTEVGEGTITTEIGTYKDYGPKNEVYLAAGQSVAFAVTPAADRYYQIGLKSPNGTSVSAALTHGADKSEYTFSHTADMYYDVAANNGGFIIITNSGNELLAVTKLKTTGTATAAVFAEAEVPTMLNAVSTFAAAPVTPVEPPVEPSEPDVDIENPEEKPERPGIIEILDKIFGSIFDWIRP